MIISTLTIFEVRMSHKTKSHSNFRFVMLSVPNFMIRVVFVNLVKNDMKSAYTRVQSSAEIQRMLRSHGGIERKQVHETFPSFARSDEVVGIPFYFPLKFRYAYCDMDVDSILIPFNILVTAYSGIPVYSRLLAIQGETSLLWSGTVHTLQKFGLLSIKIPYHHQGVPNEDRKKRFFSDIISYEYSKEIVQSWKPHENLLREVYHAAFVLREETVLLQALTVMCISSCLSWLVDAVINIVSLRRSCTFRGCISTENLNVCIQSLVLYKARCAFQARLSVCFAGSCFKSHDARREHRGVRRVIILSPFRRNPASKFS